MENDRKRFDWLGTEMPGVARLVTDRRATQGAAHVAECWRRGVLEREPGWFFAREGALAIGTPFPDMPEQNWTFTATQAMLFTRSLPEVTHGAQ